MSNIFEKKNNVDTSPDDTVTLIANIESVERINNHMSYVIRVTSGPLLENNWRVVRRYNDFANLNSKLKLSNIELGLPGKKIFGNFERDFIAERQINLQAFLNAVTSHHILSNCIATKQFLHPSCYPQECKLTELALQNVSMILRSEQEHMEVVEELHEIGWRIRKQRMLVQHIDRKKCRLLLTWQSFGPSAFIPNKDIISIMKLLPSIKHQNIYPFEFATANNAGGLVIQHFNKFGSLRDMICQSKPKENFLHKYCKPKSATVIGFEQMQNFGCQLLKALKFLSDKGFPYGHLHAGNVIVQDGGETCCLTDLENAIMGVPSFYHAFLIQFKKIQTMELVDVYCFGQLVYEMSFGVQLNAPTCEELPQSCPATVRSVLESILTVDACRSGLPAIQDLLSHIMFSAQSRSFSVDKPALKIPTKLKECLKTTTELVEKQLQEEQKLINQAHKMDKAKAFHRSDGEKMKRARSTKKLQECDVKQAVSTPCISGCLATATADLPASTSFDTVPDVHRQSPASNDVRDEVSEVGSSHGTRSERGALLQAIRSFKAPVNKTSTPVSVN